jgi:hypothetical protein
MLKKATKMDRKFSFKTLSEYYDYLINKKKFQPNQILFIDSISYAKFGQQVLMVENPMIYIGSFLNDSVSIKKSDFLKDNQACIGRMKGEIENNLGMTNYPDSMVETKINLANYNFFFLHDKNKFSLLNSKKSLKVFLLYYYPLGTYYDKLYKEIEDACLKNIEKTELYIICVDPVYMLKKE